MRRDGSTSLLDTSISLFLSSSVLYWMSGYLERRTNVYITTNIPRWCTTTLIATFFYTYIKDDQLCTISLQKGRKKLLKWNKSGFCMYINQQILLRFWFEIWDIYILHAINREKNDTRKELGTEKMISTIFQDPRKAPPRRIYLRERIRPDMSRSVAAWIHSRISVKVQPIRVIGGISYLPTEGKLGISQEVPT